MRRLILSAIIVFLAFSLLGTKASAESLEFTSIPSPIIKEKPKEEPPKPIKWIVKEGETLSAITQATNSTVERLFDKNLSLASPDVIIPAQELIIPFPEEQLASRQVVVATAPPAPQPGGEFLTGTLGYAKAGGNCVNEPGVNSPHLGRGTGPKDWPVLSKTPTIGATVVFKINHTGVVTGIWFDGSIEVRHQNYKGGKHRFYPNEIRGYR